MGWSETAGLRERFGGIREFLKRSCPHWRLGTSYSGWIAAQKREQERLVPVVIERFRAEMRELFHLMCFGRWNAFAVDGSGNPDLSRNIGGVPLGLTIADDIFDSGMDKSSVGPRT